MLAQVYCLICPSRREAILVFWQSLCNLVTRGKNICSFIYKLLCSLSHTVCRLQIMSKVLNSLLTFLGPSLLFQLDIVTWRLSINFRKYGFNAYYVRNAYKYVCNYISDYGYNIISRVHPHPNEFWKFSKYQNYQIFTLKGLLHLK